MPSISITIFLVLASWYAAPGSAAIDDTPAPAKAAIDQVGSGVESLRALLQQTSDISAWSSSKYGGASSSRRKAAAGSGTSAAYAGYSLLPQAFTELLARQGTGVRPGLEGLFAQLQASGQTANPFPNGIPGLAVLNLSIPGTAPPIPGYLRANLSRPQVSAQKAVDVAT